MIGVGVGLAGDVVETISGVPWLAALQLIPLLALLAFMWRAASNAESFGPTYFTGFTAVAWWFLPLVNLYMPYRVLREAWRTSLPENGRVPKRLLAWWMLLWIAQTFADDAPSALGFVGIALNLAWAVLTAQIAFDLAQAQAACAPSRGPALRR
ncbi:MAG TPA: DUF4328 domain-containing protein [Myxococcota bacterium]